MSVAPSKPSKKTFSFPLQLTVEQLITDALVDALRARLPKHWTIRMLKGTAEQSRGDLELSMGEHRVCVELKAEAYPGSLFPEPIQFWVTGPGQGVYKRSWAYTTTADFMLYLSTVTGMLMLCPRRAWLKTGVMLTEAALLQSLDHPEDPYRMYLTLNTGYMQGKTGQHFTGGAAGTGLATETWLKAFDHLGYDIDSIAVCSGEELLAKARERVTGWTDAQLKTFVARRIPYRSLRDARTMAAAVAEARAWSTQVTQTQTPETRRIRNAFVELGAAAVAPAEELDQLIRRMVEPLAPDSDQPLDDAMWFLATACLQCGWARRWSDETDRIVREACETRFELDERSLPEGTAVPAAMRSLELRLPAQYESRAARPSWDALKKWLRLNDTDRLAAQRDYVRAFRHASAAAPA